MSHHYHQVLIIILDEQGKSMKARFNTPCNACGGQIKVGQEIAKNNQGNWVHKECAENMST